VESGSTLSGVGGGLQNIQGITTKFQGSGANKEKGLLDLQVGYNVPYHLSSKPVSSIPQDEERVRGCSWC
jgi:hypothetical protein